MIAMACQRSGSLESSRSVRQPPSQTSITMSTRKATGGVLSPDELELMPAASSKTASFSRVASRVANLGRAKGASKTARPGP